YQQREYVLALEAIDEAILIDPVNMQARDLAGVIRRQAQIEAGKPRPENSNSESTATTEPAYQNPRASLMSDDQINRIRLMEMRKGDKQMRISFRAEVRQRYIEKHPPMTFRQFNAQSKLDQALEIRDRGSADMLDDLRIMNDPPALELFTNRIEPALVRGCATSRCHGGPNGGDFRLIAPSTNREIKYTNYHIIMNYSRLVETESTSVFSTPIVDMVRRGESAKSLLTQYSLPRSKTSLQHPDVQNFSPLIHDVDQPLYQDMVRWMDSLLQPIAPEYGFDFSYQFKTRGDETSIDESSDGSTTDESMVDDSTTEPSTQPTSEPAAE
ncbi:MAG TPA: hypothetical protein PK402_12680, partial [Tepidisphaeraceae bacterium]|nr:hypothetical protein [Tepidisphaeraceae bacterium]